MDTRAAASDVATPYRHRLELLAGSGVVEAGLEAWAAEQPGVSPRSWHRVYGKLRPGRSAWAVLVYQADDFTTVQVRLLEAGGGPDGEAGAGWTFPAGELGRLEIVSSLADPALPGLPRVLAALDGGRVIRYRPGNRCTVHGGSGATARYVKVLADGVDDQQDDRDRWEASRSGALSFAVAEPHGWDEASRSSWYGVVPGQPLQPELLCPWAERLVRQVGVSLGELAVAPLRPARIDDDSVQLARIGRGVKRASAAAPGLADGLRRAADVLAGAHARLGPRPLVPIHGAAHIGQWLVDDEGRLGLVDFDRFAWGEPEFDLATFLVELGSLSRTLPIDELEAALLDGFRAVAGEPDERRLALYVLHKRLSKVARTASALRPDAPQRAARELERLDAPLRALATP